MPVFWTMLDLVSGILAACMGVIACAMRSRRKRLHIHACGLQYAGLAVVLHHELTIPVGRLHPSGKLNVHAPVRKIVHCRTHDLQQSLLAMLGRATQALAASQGAAVAAGKAGERPSDAVSLSEKCSASTVMANP